jgi:hypothetical protein
VEAEKLELRGWKGRRRRRKRQLPQNQRKGRKKRVKCMTLTQMVGRKSNEELESGNAEEPEHFQEEDDGEEEEENKEEEEGEELEEEYPDVNQIIPMVEPLHNPHDPRALDKCLYELHPIAIVMYDIDLSFIRKIEVREQLF